MSAPLRTTMNLAAAALALAVLALGATWLMDRSHRWERPAWRHRSFVPLRGDPTAASGGPTWVVAVNPRCPHCLVTLASLHRNWERSGRQQDLVSLIVDTPMRPSVDAIRAVPTMQVWWDRHGIWRRRWGHRLYGELMQFDATGRFVRSLAAADLPDGSRPRDSTAPATTRKGGS